MYTQPKIISDSNTTASLVCCSFLSYDRRETYGFSFTNLLFFQSQEDFIATITLLLFFVQMKW